VTWSSSLEAGLQEWTRVGLEESGKCLDLIEKNGSIFLGSDDRTGLIRMG